LTGHDWLYTLDIMKRAPVQTTALKTIVAEECSCSEDGLTLNIVLSSPYALYQEGMKFAIYSKDYMESCGGGENIDWYDPAAVVGSGPYSVAEYEPDGYIVFAKRDDYWGKNYGYDDPYDTLKVVKYMDQTTMCVDMENGAIDAALDLSVQDYDRLVGITDDKIEIGRLSGNNVIMLCFDSNNNETLKDPAVREAICHSIDSAALAKAIRGSYGKAASALLSVNELGYSKDYDYSYDPERARQILADAGYADGDIHLKIVLPIDELMSSTGEALQGYLADIGIDLELDVVEIATFIRLMRTPGGTDLKIDNKNGGNFLCDPSTHLDNWADPMDPVQYRDYCERVIFEAVQTYDRDVRVEKYGELQDLWYEHFDAVPLFETDQSFAYNTDVFKDFNINSTQDLRLLDVVVK
jgi:peptide/nickel transport system substrate-binding protein